MSRLFPRRAIHVVIAGYRRLRSKPIIMKEPFPEWTNLQRSFFLGKLQRRRLIIFLKFHLFILQ